MTVQSFEDIENLPIYERRDDILASVDSNQVTIITAEKSIFMLDMNHITILFIEFFGNFYHFMINISV